MMKRLFSLLLCCTVLSCAAAPRLNYVLGIAKFTNWYNTGQSDSIYQMFSPRMQAALDAPKTKQMIQSLKAQLGQLKTTSIVQETDETTIYKAQFEQAEMMIVFSLNDQNKLSGLYFQPVAPPAVQDTDSTAEMVSLEIAEGKRIYGSLTVPLSKQPLPVVLLIAGSGPTDRNGNSPLGVHANTYAQLADSLKQAGIACLRYDKRGVGQSAAAMRSEQDLHFEDFVADASGLIRWLKKDKRFSGVYVAGHSEGALIGMLAAGKETVAGFISLAGAGTAAAVLLEKQLKDNAPQLADKAMPVLQQLKAGKTVADIDEDLAILLRPALQPFLISWFRYDPALVISKLTIPVCIIQGTTDIQVNTDEGDRLHQALPRADYYVLRNMNHVLKSCSSDPAAQQQSYADPVPGLHPELAARITAFIRRH